MRIQLMLILYCFNTIYANKYAQKILSIETNCTKELMHLKLNMERPFKGMVFAKGFMEECGSTPGSNLLTLPLASCGIRSKMISKDVIEYRVRLVAQIDTKLQQQNDLETNARCELPSEMMDVKIDSNEMKTQRNGRMRVLKSSTKIRSWLDIESVRQDFAIVGENASLSAMAILPRSIGMRIVDCIAFDGVGDSSQKLFDEFGCAVDPLLMPDFKQSIMSFEQGWSKSDDDDVVQKVFNTKFQAFKFPDKDIVHFSCGILLCKNECSNECDGNLSGRNDHILGRLEIFNSLKVIAPQIESIDRPAEKNITSSDSSASQSTIYVGPDVLCVSQSKLAMAFCTLGLIFLLAVIVAIVCSMRYLTHKRSYRRSRLSSDHSHSGRRSVFSISSSSNNFSQSSLEIDSKLFAYGRVY